MNAETFLDHIIAQGAELWVEDDNLRCRGPKQVLTPDALQTLKQHKPELLQILQTRKSAGIQSFPLSGAQQAIWNAWQANPNSAAYNVNAVVQVNAQTRESVLRDSLERVVRRHEGLSCVFDAKNGIPKQTIKHNLIPEMIVASAVKREELDDSIDNVIDASFDLVNSLPIRLHLFRCDDNSVWMVFVLHHIASDFWGAGVFLDELASVYDALSQDSEPNLVPLKLTLKEIVTREARLLSDISQQDMWQYWENQLADVPPRLRLPADFYRPQVLEHNGETFSCDIGHDESLAVRKFAKEWNTTPYVILLTVYQLLLSRIAGQNEFLLGAPTAGRTHLGSEGMVGNFVNLLVLRPQLDLQQNFQTLVQSSREQLQQALQYQSVPYIELVKRFLKQRDPAYAPFFDVVFNWNKVTSQQSLSTGLVESFERGSSTGRGGATHDLALSIVEQGDNLRCLWTFNTSIFKFITVESFAESFQILLVDALVSTQQSVATLELVTTGGMDSISENFSGTIQAVSEMNIAERFACVVNENSENTALSEGKLTVSYAELDNLSDRLAARLLMKDTGIEKIVAICLPRGISFVTACLAVLKSGAAYLPIAVSTPIGRIERICADANVALMITSESDTVPPEVQQITPGDEIETAEFVPVIGTQNSNAYVIYTSGSTGTPKGVAVSQASLNNLIDWHNRSYQVGVDTVSAQTASVGFDACAWELWPYLCAGSNVHIVPEDVIQQPLMVPAWLEANQVTHCFMPTPMYEAVPDSAWEVSQSLCYMLVGGDVLRSQSTTRRFRLFNHYGPTENTVVATAGEVLAGDLHGASLPDIGSPIDNNQVMILDQVLNVVPIGACGELVVSGASLARGYQNDPVRTALSFVPNPYSKEPGVRMYMSGDLARYRRNERIEFLGRRDNQVKVRGYRIELNEIASVLRSLDGVSAAAVVVSGENSQQRLVGFVSVDDDDFNADALLHQLKHWLPVYMTPTSLVSLSQMPLTANGKLDRSVLQALASEQTLGEKIAPSNECEARLVRLWGEVLGIEEIGVTDNFFELGGHSLLAAQLADRIRHEFKREIGINTLLTQATVRELAIVLMKDSASDAGNTVSLYSEISLEADSASRHEPFPLTDTQHAYWIGRTKNLELGNTATHIYTESEFDVYDQQETDEVWNQLIQRHDMLRMVVDIDGRQRVLADVGEYNIVIDDLSALNPENREQKLMETRARMSHQVFEPQSWPLFEIGVSKITEDCYRLHTSIDGLIADARSFGIINFEYYMLAAGRADELPKLDITFRDYIMAERHLRDSGHYQRSKDYWMQRLDTLPAAPMLPLATDPRSISQPKFRRHEGRLSAENWASLKNIARDHQVTPSVVLLSAFATVLSAWSEDCSFTLNLTLFNRLPLHEQVNNLVGDFTSLTLLELNMEDNPGFIDLVSSTQHRLWQDIEHRYFSGVEALRELGRRSNGSQGAIMPVVFTSVLPLDGQSEETTQEVPEILEGRDIYTITQTSQVWIDHVVSEKQGALHFNWDVVDQLFPEGLIDSMFSAYTQLIELLAKDAEAWRQSQRPGLSDQQHQRREAVNATQWNRNPTLLFDGFFEKAALAPDSTALIHGELQLSYGQLAAMSKTLAKKLREAGVKRSEPVAIVMHKGWEQVLATLAITFAGGAYLPIDASLPEARRRQLLEQGQVRFSVTQLDLQDSLAELSTQQTFIVDSSMEIDLESIKDFHRINSPADIAYIIFTSGTTGVPKGVVIDHCAAANTIADINDRFSVSDSDRVLALSALSFDLSVYDIFGLLAAGGSIVIPSEKAVRNPEHWAHLLSECGITIINAVPSFLQMLVDYSEAQSEISAERLRLVMMSGDWIPVPLTDRIRQLRPEVEVHSLGGATEASIWSITYPVTTIDYAWPSIPYGQPLKNQSYHVLRADMSDCPDWVSGELYISGIGLAREYYRDNERTQQAFVIHPDTGVRLYRTGDLGRYLPDGNIEFLGRVDTQVKVQGHRIELGEIETHLLQHAAVKDAVVQVGGEGSSKALFAYVVAHQKAADQAAISQRSVLDYEPDNIEQDGSDLIQDPLERMLFKFAHHGLRQLPDSENDINLEIFIPGYATAAKYCNELADFQTIANWLSVLRSFSVADNPLLKYLYPSAGSLYPVQIYLGIGEDVASRYEINPGYYYYHPERHALCLLPVEEQSDTKQGIQGIFVSEDRAIRPIYGSLTNNFVSLEAGYMFELLNGNAMRLGMGMYTVENSELNIKLDAQQTVVGAFALQTAKSTVEEPSLSVSGDQLITARQSYREFEGAMLTRSQMEQLLAEGMKPLQNNNELFVLVGVKADRVGGLAAGWYHWQFDNGLQPLIGNAEMNQLFTGENAPTAITAGWTVLICCRDQETQSSVEFITGLAGQRLMMTSPQESVGWCPIGYVREDILNAEVSGGSIPDSFRVVHGFLGGTIALEQTTRWVQLEKPNQETALARELTAHLKERLPSYMIPREIISIGKIPLTANGKVDRTALPEPESTLQQRRSTFVAPDGELEQQVAAVWRSVLEVENVGRFDNFFDIGGNSVLLVQVFAKLQTRINADLQIADLFTYTTIADLAAFISQRDDSDLGLDKAKQRAEKARRARHRRLPHARKSGARH